MPDEQYGERELVRMRPLALRHPLSLLKEMDEWFNSAVGEGLLPALDIEETDDAYIVTAEVPGFDKSNVEIELANNVLTLRGKRVKTEGRRFLRRERVQSVSEFERSIALPGDVDGERATASFTNGELVVTLPKAKSDVVRRIALD